MYVTCGCDLHLQDELKALLRVWADRNPNLDKNLSVFGAINQEWVFWSNDPTSVYIPEKSSIGT